MQEFVKFVLLIVVGFSILFPCGQLYIRGRLGWKGAAAAGGLLGFATGIIWGWPSYEPRGATVGATAALAITGAIVLGWLIGLMPRFYLPLPPRK